MASRFHPYKRGPNKASSASSSTKTPPGAKATTPSKKAHPTPPSVKDLLKTKDDFTAHAVEPDTIWYLTISTPSEDTWRYHGPTKTFVGLMPIVESTIKASASKTALAKWQKLIADDAEEQRLQDYERENFGDDYVARRGVHEKLRKAGISTFVIPRVLFGTEEGAHTILRVVREVNPAVYKMLPASVYTVTCEGPILTEHVLMPEKERQRILEYQRASGKEPLMPAPRATTSKIVGSYATTAAMRAAVKETMDGMLAGIEAWKVMRSEAWGMEDTTKKAQRAIKAKGKAVLNGDATGGLVLAMSSDARWEVKIKYDEDALTGALDKYDRDPKNVREGRTAAWRTASTRS